MEIPETVKIDKEKVMKGWSYPLTTSDILEALSEEVLKDRIKIKYENTNLTKDPSSHGPIHSQWVVLIQHYADTYPEYFEDFHITIESITANKRKEVRTIFKKKALPFVSRWMEDQGSNDINRNLNKTLVVRYWRWPSEEKGKIEIIERPCLMSTMHRCKSDSKTLLTVKDVLIQ